MHATIYIPYMVGMYTARHDSNLFHKWRPLIASICAMHVAAVIMHTAFLIQLADKHRCCTCPMPLLLCFCRKLGVIRTAYKHGLTGIDVRC